ncbi:7552_t:CDS:2, partial [Cetraspora pellucida]
EQVTLYAEEIPQEEIELGADDKIIHVFHFTKELLCAHGIPFKFVLKADESFSEAKLRLRLRLGMSEKDFSKVKIAIVRAESYTDPEYIDDDDLVLSWYDFDDDQLLGLDYLETKTERAGIVGSEKAIFIRE